MVNHVIKICDVILGPHNVRNGSYIVQTLAASSLDCPLTERVIIMEFAGSRTLQNILDNEKEIIHDKRRIKFASHITIALEFVHGL